MAMLDIFKETDTINVCNEMLCAYCTQASDPAPIIKHSLQSPRSIDIAPLPVVIKPTDPRSAPTGDRQYWKHGLKSKEDSSILAGPNAPQLRKGPLGAFGGWQVCTTSPSLTPNIFLQKEEVTE